MSRTPEAVLAELDAAQSRLDEAEERLGIRSEFDVVKLNSRDVRNLTRELLIRLGRDNAIVLTRAKQVILVESNGTLRRLAAVEVNR